MSFKDTYSDQWAKAARDTGRVIQDLGKWFGSQGLKLVPGHGAISDEVDHSDHDPGSPDIYLEFAGEVIGAVEVTGSNKINWPCNPWIGDHKIKWFVENGTPTAYVLVYRNARRFVTGQMILTYSPPIPQDIKLYGTIERYRVLKPHHTQPYEFLKAWIDGLILTRKKDLDLLEAVSDSGYSGPWWWV